MKRRYGALLGAFLSGFLLCNIAVAAEVELNPSHPESYIVVKGDTLWDISARFLKSPWRWPDIWQVNSQIENPHLIFLGDEIELSFVDGKPQLSLKRGHKKLSPEVRKSSLESAIPVVPVSAIVTFLNTPRVMTLEEYESAPYIVAFSDEHILGSAGFKAYVRSIEKDDQDGYNVIRQGEEYLDGGTGEKLGFESVFIAEGEILKTGDPATIKLSKSTREAVKGDRLLPAIEGIYVQQYFPRAPEREVDGHIIGVVDGVTQIGQYNIVVIDRGEEDGIKNGHVLRVDHRGELARDVVIGGGEEVRLPDEEAGTIMVFRVFKRVSYGLVMEAKRVMHRLDRVKTPE
ncbi:MAG: peptidoglycan-binding LysM-like protein [Cycloclasticus sp. symbiont of Poecilosclerida sp. M]|nr:MAG: peptidoglycan-binding LysM-like protein [Cycloclasticus sp. symbiont of Poecilosclerida sp. M]